MKSIMLLKVPAVKSLRQPGEIHDEVEKHPSSKVVGATRALGKLNFAKDALEAVRREDLMFKLIARGRREDIPALK